MSNSSAILILSHVLNKDVAALRQDIVTTCTSMFDVFLLGDNTENQFSNVQSEKGVFLFTRADLENLDFPGKGSIAYSGKASDHGRYHKDRNFVMGNTELPILHFFRKFKGYQFYWVVEYDVRFSGDWRELFLHFVDSKADLLTTSLTGHDSVPYWPKWASLRLNDKEFAKGDLLRGFFPIYRISNTALAQLDRDYRSGVGGHYECLMPTLLSHAGLELEDIGGNGSFTKPQNFNRFYQNTLISDSYAPGTFVFRPVRNRPGSKPNTLWHPVKSRPFWRVWLSRLRSIVFD